MARNKYIYHHFFNGKEVSKEDFIKELEKICERCDTNYDNPLLNISYVDYKMVKRKYDSMKCHPRTIVYYINRGISFCIERELKQ